MSRMSIKWESLDERERSMMINIAIPRSNISIEDIGLKLLKKLIDLGMIENKNFGPTEEFCSFINEKLGVNNFNVTK